MSEPAPWPLIEVAVAPTSEADAARLAAALLELGGRDPAFRSWTDRESGQTIVGAADEAQLHRHIDAVTSICGPGVQVGALQVAYREILGRGTQIDATHKRALGPRGEFARVTIAFEPGAPGSGYVFACALDGRSGLMDFVSAVERGLAAAREDGLLAGFPVIDFTATLLDGAWHDLDSSPLAFEIAARAAFRRLRDEELPRLAEPIMRVEVTTPEDHADAVIGDLNGRRGMIQGTDQDGDQLVIIAHAPLARLLGYADDLKAMTEGQASVRMDYSHYESVPQTSPPDDTFPEAMTLRA